MDKQYLKSILEKQSGNLNNDVQKKLAMLESGDVFTDPNRYVQEILDEFTVSPATSPSIQDASLEAAFGMSDDSGSYRQPAEVSFQNAFKQTQQPVYTPQQQYQQPQPQYNSPQLQSAPSVRSYESQSTATQNYADNNQLSANIENRKKALAMKIAALRGITLPGDYLNNKRS